MGFKFIWLWQKLSFQKKGSCSGRLSPGGDGIAAMSLTLLLAQPKISVIHPTPSKKNKMPPRKQQGSST